MPACDAAPSYQCDVGAYEGITSKIYGKQRLQRVFLYSCRPYIIKNFKIYLLISDFLSIFAL